MNDDLLCYLVSRVSIAKTPPTVCSNTRETMHLHGWEQKLGLAFETGQIQVCILTCP